MRVIRTCPPGIRSFDTRGGTRYRSLPLSVAAFVINILWFAGGLAVAAGYAVIVIHRRNRAVSQQHAAAERARDHAADHAADQVADLEDRLSKQTAAAKELERERNRLENRLHNSDVIRGCEVSHGLTGDTGVALTDELKLLAETGHQPEVQEAPGNTDPDRHPEHEADPHAAKAGATCPITVEAQPLTQTLSHELANIVSGIEGGAFRLIEATPLPPTRSNAAEGLWLAIRRLRRFHDKVRAFVTVPERNDGTLSVESLLLSLREELEASELGLQMAWNLPRTLPMLRGDDDALLGGLVFLSSALQQLALGALRLSIDVEVSFEREQPLVQLELSLEWDEDPGRHPQPTPTSAAFLLARAAAQNLLRSQDCSCSIDLVPSHLARAVVRMPAVYTQASPMQSMLSPQILPTAAKSPIQSVDRNRFGGVLILESDPTVRTMLASELKACGRAVFACADGAAARSLMQATPDRFEMLIVDQANRLAASDQLATTAAHLCPDLKLFVLSDGAESELPVELTHRIHHIRKPFGVRELRRALASVLNDPAESPS